MHGIFQAQRIVNHLRRRFAFDADAAIGVIGIGFEADELAVLHRGDHAAARLAHRTIGANQFFAVFHGTSQSRFTFSLRLTLWLFWVSCEEVFTTETQDVRKNRFSLGFALASD